MNRQGVKLILKSSGKVLALRTAESCDLPSAETGPTVPELREATEALYKQITGSKGAQLLIPAYRGWDEEFGVSSSYVADWDGIPKSKKGQKAEWASLQDVMCGKWGLFARDAFHRLKLINRPKLDIQQLYRISKKATREGSGAASEGVDLILDEIVFLTDIGKSYAVDDMLRSMQVERLHADILAATISFVEDRTDLPYKQEFCEKAHWVIEQIDGPRRTFVLKDENGKVLSKDVRGDALKYYRKKAKEFGEQLRAGTLGQGLHRGGTPLQRKKAN